MWVVKTVIAETSRTTSPNGRPLGLHHRADHLQGREGAVPLVEMQDRRDESPARAGPAPRRRPGAAPGGSGPARRRRRAAPSATGPTRVFSGTFESRSSSVVRPTSTRQTRACSTPVVVSTATSSGWPSGPATLSIGSSSMIGVQVKLLLPAVGVERLAEIALGVQAGRRRSAGCPGRWRS